MKSRTVVMGAVLWLMGLVMASASASDESPLPRLYGLSIKKLVAAKRLIALNDPGLRTPYAMLIKNADLALLARPESVMDKAKVAASGNKHDFFSYGPYWWPDPRRPDGLPYVKRDGYIYPGSKIGTDSVSFVHMCNNAEALAYAYYFTGRDIYAKKAAEVIRVWFLNPATAMNPSANYGQAVPGVIDGRGEGVIEMRHLTRITDAIALIEPSLAWTKSDQSAFRRWLELYYDWLTHTKQSIDETSTENNHRSWRDVQLVQFSLVLGKTEQARTLLQQELPRLLEMQIKSQGEQQRELVRTNSLGYSLFNLEALFRLATLGDYVGVDCWKYAVKNHGGLYAALDYLAPYSDPGNPWPVDEVKPAERWRLLPLLIQAYDQNKDKKYKGLLDRFYGDGPNIWRLFWPYLIPSQQQAVGGKYQPNAFAGEKP